MELKRRIGQSQKTPMERALGQQKETQTTGKKEKDIYIHTCMYIPLDWTHWSKKKVAKRQNSLNKWKEI